MKQNSSKTSSADSLDATEADVFAALTADHTAETTDAAPRRTSSLTGSAVLAIAAVILTVGLAGGAASAAAASIPESAAMASADTESIVLETTSAGAPTEVTPEAGPITEGRWEYSFAPVQWKQRDAVLAANVSPPPQPEGYGWALVELNVRNVGAQPATPGRFEVVLHTGGWQVSHLDVGRQPLRMPGEYSARELAPDEQASGNLGFWLPDYAADAGECLIELRVYPATDASYTSHWLTCD